MSNCGSSTETLEALAQRLGHVLAQVAPLGARVLFDLGGDGQLFVDARSRPAAVSVGKGPADCTLSMQISTLERILGGELDGTIAFMQGEMTISGDVELAVRLNELLSDALTGAGGGVSRD